MDFEPGRQTVARLAPRYSGSIDVRHFDRNFLDIGHFLTQEPLDKSGLLFRQYVAEVQERARTADKREPPFGSTNDLWICGQIIVLADWALGNKADS